jgi:hypothetical protein
MMNRRGFLARMVLGATVALHTELHSLVPTLDFAPKLPWFYLIEETTPATHEFTMGGKIRGWMRRIRWIDEKEMLSLGLKHEDFADDWKELGEEPKPTGEIRFFDYGLHNDDEGGLI